jgi:hypothetical protein
MEKICEICGKIIQNNDEEKWLTGYVHKSCKKKEEKKIQDSSETVYQKKNIKKDV